MLHMTVKVYVGVMVNLITVAYVIPICQMIVCLIVLEFGVVLLLVMLIIIAVVLFLLDTVIVIVTIYYYGMNAIQLRVLLS